MRKYISAVQKNGIDIEGLNIDKSSTYSILGKMGEREPSDEGSFIYFTLFQEIYNDDCEVINKIDLGTCESITVTSTNRYTGKDIYIPDFADSISDDCNEAFLSCLDDDVCINDMCYESIGYIKGIRISPQYRNRGLGSLFVKWVTRELLSEVESVLVKPFPIEFKDKDNTELLNKKIRRIQNFYRRLGFTKKTETIMQYNYSMFYDELYEN